MIHSNVKRDTKYVVVLNQDGLILDINENFSATFGLSNQVMDQFFADLTVNRSKENITEWLKMIKMGAITVYLITLELNDKSTIEMRLEGTYSKATDTYICFLTELESFHFYTSDDDQGPTTDQDLSDVVNKDLFQTLMDDFYKLTGVPIGIIDLKGNILVAEGWQDICTKYHRIHPDSCANCRISDLQLTEGIKQGEFREYKCKNNMWDVATPIYIDQKKKGHIFIGQFFYDDEIIDFDIFKGQAKKYNFNEASYLSAVAKVPRFSRETVQLAMSFYSKLADIIAELSYANASLNKTNQVLKDSNIFKQTLIDAIPSPVFYKDSKLRYRGYNKAFEKVVGGSKDQVVGKSVSELFSEQYVKVYNDADQDLINNPGVQSYEASVVYTDKTVHDVLFQKATFTDSIGRVAGIIGVISDITDRKKMEKDLLDSKTNLEFIVEDRTSELVASNEELIALNEELTATLDNLKLAQEQLILSEKMAALGSLVAGISHEISTPLGISLTSVSYVDHELSDLKKKYIKDGMSKKDFEDFLSDAKESLLIADKNLKRADHLLNSFRVIAIDQTNNEWRAFKVHDYTEDIIFSLDPLLKSKDCSVSLSCPDSLIINGYPGVYAQIITNLVTNSIMHAFDETTHGKIQISIEEKGKYYDLDYHDNGVGMTDDVQQRAFDPFFTTKRGSQGGTGLGLHLVYNLVTQKLSGTIELDSKQGEGTHFKIKFPSHIPMDSED